MTDEPENLTLALLREIRAGQVAMQAKIDDLAADMREVKLAVALLEVRTARMADSASAVMTDAIILPCGVVRSADQLPAGTLRPLRQRQSLLAA